ncbi:MAG TPA: hypothetical protein VEN28_07445 [Burkholderiaceae bacterium]|nr:hypothetical protein [Burkholderiaceae bacterium]
MNATNEKVVALPQWSAEIEGMRPIRVTLASIAPDGTLWVDNAAGQRFHCDFLESGALADLRLSPGDVLLAQPPDGVDRGVVLGRIARYRVAEHAAAQPHVTVEATESLTLKCGAASIDLRADGKLMVKGEDVLVKARGTQRIKAGSVNIN